MTTVTRSRSASTKKAAKGINVITETRKALRQVRLGKVRAVDAVRFVAAKYPTLTRADLLAIADAEGVNRHTANTQFYGTRAGRFEAPESLK